LIKIEIEWSWSSVYSRCEGLAKAQIRVGLIRSSLVPEIITRIYALFVSEKGCMICYTVQSTVTGDYNVQIRCVVYRGSVKETV
jgi:hypothetical protein